MRVVAVVEIMLNYKNYYNEDLIQVPYERIVESEDGQILIMDAVQEVKTNRYPQLVVKTWLSKILSELPKVYNGNDEINISDLDLNTLVSGVLAYGKILVVPQILNDKQTFDYIYHQDVEYTIENEILNEVTFIYNDLLYEYTRTDGIVELIVSDGTTILQRDTFADMPVFFIENRGIEQNGLPVYADAIKVIERLNFNDFEESLDQELSRKEVLIPDSRLKDGRRSLDKTPLLNAKTRKFRVIPGEQDGDNKPIFTDGKFTPEPYSNVRDNYLHILSIHVGFGARYLSFDNQNGGLKTATEVVSEKSELYQNKKLHDRMLIELITNLLNSYQILLKEEQYVNLLIECSDNIIQDDQARQQQLFQEVVAGIISNEYYLKEVYNLDDAEVQNALPQGMTIEQQQ